MGGGKFQEFFSVARAQLVLGEVVMRLVKKCGWKDSWDFKAKGFEGS